MAPPVDIEDPHPVETIHSSVSPRSSHTPPTLVPVVLRISPSHDGGPSGFIYLDVYELNDQAAITAYFANAGRVTTVLPCQNFDEFLVSNSLSTRQVSFLSDLPASIVAMGRHILAENAASEEAGPDLSWLPRSPSMSSATLLSHPARSVPRYANITTRVGTGRAPRSSRPDPDGFDFSWLPRSPSMSSAMLLSHPACSVPRSANITTWVGTGRAPRSSCPDPDGFDFSWLPRSPLMSSAMLLSHPARSVPRSANITTRVGTDRSSCSSRPDPDGTKATTVSFATAPTVQVFHANNIVAMFT